MMISKIELKCFLKIDIGIVYMFKVGIIRIN